ncbi:MAG: hypothetical protein ABIO70_03840 [Pseudomonadota bacterium]
MLDLLRSRAEADAAERRGAGTLWAAEPVAWENVSVGAVNQPEVVPVADDAGAVNPPALPRAVSVRGAEPARIAEEAHAALLTAILARLETAAPPVDTVPPWLMEAIGNPLTYDAASARRKDVCARVDPGLYRRLQAMKERLGLRTTAGAWEYVLRAGLAVGERGTTASP